MTSKKREPWHYDVFEGRPAWSIELGRLSVIRRQQENVQQWKKLTAKRGKQ